MSFQRLLLATLFASPLAAFADGNPNMGKRAFQNQCTACHTMTPESGPNGPSLTGVVGRKAGAVSDFKYSDALKRSGLTWDEKTLDEYLTNPTGKVPGTSMTLGVGKAQDRANVVAYLKTLSGK
ncbi:MAG TPA: cytochrome c family protein [Opitutaceae bacterium]|nr:cytochrome c family protein [Opitutaceae bacterium]